MQKDTSHNHRQDSPSTHLLSAAEDASCSIAKVWRNSRMIDPGFKSWNLIKTLICARISAHQFTCNNGQILTGIPHMSCVFQHVDYYVRIGLNTFKPTTTVANSVSMVNVIQTSGNRMFMINSASMLLTRNVTQNLTYLASPF